jgi:hypothetical protein
MPDDDFEPVMTLESACRKLEQENERLKADVAMLRDALNGVMCEWPEDFDKARSALSATASSDDWLKEEKAKVLEDVLDNGCFAQYVEDKVSELRAIAQTNTSKE